ncbi:cof family protein [Enterococcus haemoperoxidus ATCC BAA-382]|uniref:Cof family protein n=1 Tax=Enterococcus haemoperoxidus ATCC BAA-382 TaxID=1158608 RepID=R2QY00_9ENTE|nr:cof family protein [Enterococcus haemoperoxidus]EOI00271.1 cof family protein [Enterococcus haemoperoxidus ATCC BAA-382]EOT59639.1 cof family protein [Enterococcus haemoperoxidus ATCC BAA-382]OJG53108.1 cof family protein [Enterococcus haemoperoxidus]
MKIDNPFEKTEAFHAKFDNRKPKTPTNFSAKQASDRAGFKVEELVEFLYGSANNDPEVFNQLVNQLKVSVDQAQVKVLDKQKKVTDPLVEQVDALIDLLYFTYGSFSLLGVDPTEIFSIVHEANMGKIFPDGKPHYHPVTHKVLKPDNWEADFAPEPKIKAEIERQTKAAETE